MKPIYAIHKKDEAGGEDQIALHTKAFVWRQSTDGRCYHQKGKSVYGDYHDINTHMVIAVSHTDNVGGKEVTKKIENWYNC